MLSEELKIFMDRYDHLSNEKIHERIREVEDDIREETESIEKLKKTPIDSPFGPFNHGQAEHMRYVVGKMEEFIDKLKVLLEHRKLSKHE